MPDARVKIIKGDFPERSFMEKMKVGDSVLWIPSEKYLQCGCTPTLYKQELIHTRGKKIQILMPYPADLAQKVANG